MVYNEVTEIELPKIKDLRGNLSFLEEGNHIPFKINRAYWIYDVPGGEGRGGHAYTNTAEFIIPLSGAFTVEVSCGEKNTTYRMSRTNKGLFVPKMTWREINDFTSNSVCLVVSDTMFSDCEYIRDFMEYIRLYNLSR